MHNIRLTDSTYDVLSVQAGLMGITVDELVERHFAVPNLQKVDSVRSWLGLGKGKGAFNSKEDVTTYIRDLRDEWDR
jgi:hypothetical protein